MYNKKKTLEIDRLHIWHPFTQMKDFENQDPKVIVRGEGVKLFDADGNEYYDTISSWWVNTLGHCNKEIVEEITKQLNTLEHVNFSAFTHPFAAEFIDLLSQFVDKSLSKYFFSDNGSTAVEVAIKMSFQYWLNQGKKSKTRFIMMDNAYHGDTIGAVSVGGVEEYHRLYKPLMFSSIKVPSPNCSACKYRKSEFTFDATDCGCNLECFEEMEKAIRENCDSVAAVIVEPLIQCAGGMIVYNKEYLQLLEKTAKKHSVLIIYDEVATGFGRCGTMFAYEKSGTVPDIIALSKGITAGFMPLAVTVATDEVYNAFYDDYSAGKTFFHGHSYTANPIACSAGIGNLKILKRENLPASNEKVMKHFQKRLSELKKYDFINDIRYVGFIGAIDIVKSRKDKISFAPTERIGKKIYELSLNSGLVLRPLGDTIYFFLPLIVTLEDIDEIFDRAEIVISEAVKI
ncbi:MAG: adenosylmethionine--8-amino-7-oxononanoate transaminase [bacterium]